MRILSEDAMKGFVSNIPNSFNTEQKVLVILMHYWDCVLYPDAPKGERDESVRNLWNFIKLILEGDE